MTTIGAAQIAAYAAAAGFKGNALVTATAIALAESSGRTDVVNYLGCVGLWQIYQAMHAEYSTAALKNPAVNAAAAYAISKQGTDFRPWETYTNGMYIVQLGQARLGAAAVTQSSAGSNSVQQAVSIQQFGSGLLDGATGGVTAPLNAIGSGVDGALTGLSSIATLGISGAQWIGNGHNWVRVIEVIAGGAAILVGLKMLADSGVPSPVVDVAHGADQTVQHAEHAAGKVAEVGALAA